MEIERLQSTECTHLLIYDWDGCVYAKRFWKELRSGDMEQCVNRLSVTDIINKGFGGNARVEALKRHFAHLNRYCDGTM